MRLMGDGTDAIRSGCGMGLPAQTGLAGARQDERGMALRALGVLAEPLGPLLGDLQLERVVQVPAAGNRASNSRRRRSSSAVTRPPDGFQREGVLRDEQLLAQMTDIRGAGHHIGASLCLFRLQFLLLLGFDGSRDGQPVAGTRLLEW